MKDVIIDGNKLGEAKQLATKLETRIKKTHTNCKTLISTVSSSSWKGKSRDAFLSYLEIIEQYHKELAAAVKLQTKALNNLDNYISDFPRDHRVRRMKNI